MRLVWQFSTANDLSGLLIRYGTRSEWSHVDAVLPDGTLLGARIEGGVQIRQPGYAKFTDTMLVAIETPHAARIYDVLLTQVGKSYDWRAIAAFAFGNRDWRDDDSWFCSELQVWAVEQAGFFDRALNIQTDRLSPRDQLLLFSPWIEIINSNDSISDCTKI